MRVGIIGCGTITQVRHAPEYANNPKAELTAWFDVLPEKACELAKKYGGKVFHDWHDLIQSGSCDAISICTPNSTHAEIAVEALKNGLHVLCEKPMAVTLSECRSMVEAASKNRRLLFIGQNQRMLKAHRMAKEMIAEGRIGKVLSFQTSFGHSGPDQWAKTKDSWFFDQKEAAFGAMFDLGIHKVDLIHYLLNDEVEEVAAFTATMDKTFSDGRPIGVEDNAVAIFRMRKGTYGQLNASWTHYARQTNDTRIYGTKGMLCMFEDEKAPLVFTGLDGKDISYDVGAIQTNENQFDSGIIDAFVRDVSSGGPAEISGEDVLQSMKAVFAMVESAKCGKYIKIKE